MRDATGRGTLENAARENRPVDGGCSRTPAMKPNDSGPLNDRGSRRLEQAAKQLRLARSGADAWSDAALRSMEMQCYELLTGGVRRASELPETGAKQASVSSVGDSA